jgi:peptidoglycan biosynthesis protein MviN/MurJ (putative lipid II flippase)
MSRSLLSASVFVSFALLLSRLSGLIREQVLGAQLGLSAQSDAVLLILTLPDFLTGLLLSGGFGAALVPALSKAAPADRVTLLRRIGIWTLVGSVGLAALIFMFMPVFVGLLAPRLDTDAVRNFPIGFFFAAATLPVAAVIGLSSAYLNVKGLYSLPAYSVLVFNCALIFYFLFGLRDAAVDFAVFGMVLLAASFLRLGFQVIRMRETITDYSTTARFDAGFGARFAQGVLAYSVVVGAPIIYRSLFALEGPGALSQFNYALRLFDLQTGLLVAPLVLVFLPLLSGLPSAHDPVFKARTIIATQAAFVICTISAVVTAVFARPIAAVLFGYGEMAGGGADSIASTTTLLMIGLPFMAVFQIMGAALNASGRTGIFLQYSATALAMSLLFYVALRLGAQPPDLSAKLGLVSFSIWACALGLNGVLGAKAALVLACSLALRGLGIIALVAPVALLLPWGRDGIVTAGDLIVIAAVGLILLLVNLRLFQDLAAIRDRPAAFV